MNSLRFAMILTCLASAAVAGPDWKAGQLITPISHYDASGQRTNKPAPGLKGTCWRVKQVIRKTPGYEYDGYELTLVSGVYRPEYEEGAAFKPPYTDVWFSSYAYLDENPKADVWTELHQTFRAVTSCPKARS
ncbi:hypothetical protein [Actibacterium sp. 188UL27-1]|uniref:hypothetical protein n=1 Tax=Actibacterium sp. 188UL27-1 TaxID=2786961 RepID=UPI001956C91F|nr:hypothetical protein [Actibacterium sp. 188UL27-1]MBM7068347.1 hypothetical protein [Actibacterium sp. 188UL27-1]